MNFNRTATINVAYLFSEMMDDFLDEDFGEGYTLDDGGKKCSLFLVDASPKMFDNCNARCAFTTALSVRISITEVICSHFVFRKQFPTCHGMLVMRDLLVVHT